MANGKNRQDSDILDGDEVRKLLAQCSRKAPTGIRDRALLVVMYRAGLRVSEALDLKPSDIDYQHGTIRVLHGKGDKARTVAIDDGGLAEVQVWVAKRAELGIGNRAKLFCTLRGTPLSANQVRQMVKRRAGERHAKIAKRVHPHGLRHAYAVEMSREGKSLKTIQDQLGHSSIATTDVYLRGLGSEDALREAKNRTWSAE